MKTAAGGSAAPVRRGRSAARNFSAPLVAAAVASAAAEVAETHSEVWAISWETPQEASFARTNLSATGLPMSAATRLEPEWEPAWTKPCARMESTSRSARTKATVPERKNAVNPSISAWAFASRKVSVPVEARTGATKTRVKAQNRVEELQGAVAVHPPARPDVEAADARAASVIRTPSAAKSSGTQPVPLCVQIPVALAEAMGERKEPSRGVVELMGKDAHRAIPPVATDARVSSAFAIWIRSVAPTRGMMCVSRNAHRIATGAPTIRLARLEAVNPVLSLDAMAVNARPAFASRMTTAAHSRGMPRAWASAPVAGDAMRREEKGSREGQPRDAPHWMVPAVEDVRASHASAPRTLFAATTNGTRSVPVSVNPTVVDAIRDPGLLKAAREGEMDALPRTPRDATAVNAKIAFAPLTPTAVKPPGMKRVSRNVRRTAEDAGETCQLGATMAALRVTHPAAEDAPVNNASALWTRSAATMHGRTCA